MTDLPPKRRPSIGGADSRCGAAILSASLKLALGLAVCGLIARLATAEESGVAEPSSSESLGDALLEPVDVRPAASTGQPDAPMENNAQDAAKQTPLAPSSSGSQQSLISALLVPIAQNMQQATASLDQNHLAGDASRFQRIALSRIDEALAQLDRQRQQCMAKLDKPGKPNPSSVTPGQDLSLATAPVEVVEPGVKAALSSYVDEVWGRLPERQREQLLQPLSERFLPEYADDIRMYFRELAEPKRDEAEH